MKSVIFRDDNVRNFGDELNLWMWNRLLDQKHFAEAPGLLMGIGTLLEQGFMPTERPLIVFGSGGGYGTPPSLEGIDVRFVRGPRTAKLLGTSRWITDPAILVADTEIKDPGFRIPCAFMPHWTTAVADPKLGDKMEALGIGYIDPSTGVDGVLSQIRATDLLITEALHGAVVADALRIPWIPVLLAQGHTFKWFDWCESMMLPYDPAPLNAVSIPWVRNNWQSYTSTDRTHRSRLFEVKRELDILRFDIELGNFG
jgi:succinoglycan biosynthesis protein ExoV